MTELEKKYLGKRIEVPYKHPSGLGSSKPTVAGICEFIGYNKYFPEWGLQVTIGRMPVTNINLSEIKIIK